MSKQPTNKQAASKHDRDVDLAEQATVFPQPNAYDDFEEVYEEEPIPTPHHKKTKGKHGEQTEGDANTADPFHHFKHLKTWGIIVVVAMILAQVLGYFIN